MKEIMTGVIYGVRLWDGDQHIDGILRDKQIGE